MYQGVKTFACLALGHESGWIDAQAVLRRVLHSRVQLPCSVGQGWFGMQERGGNAVDGGLSLVLMLHSALEQVHIWWRCSI